MNKQKVDSRKRKFQAVQNLQEGQTIFLWGLVPIGQAARDILAGSIINYTPDTNTKDVITEPEKAKGAEQR